MSRKLIFLSTVVFTLSACGGSSQNSATEDNPVSLETLETTPVVITPVVTPETTPIVTPETTPVTPIPVSEPLDSSANPTTVDRPDDLSTEELALIQSLENINDHLSGIKELSNEAILQEKVDINKNLSVFESNTYLVQLAFETVELYDNTHGAMFTNGSASDGASCQE